MAGNPRIVTEDAEFTWDGVPARLPKGSLVDVPEGSALEAAIGLDNLTPMFRAGSTALPPEPPAEGAGDDSAKDEAPSASSRKKAAQAAVDKDDSADGKDAS